MLTKTFNDLENFKQRRLMLNRLAPNAAFILFAGEEGHLDTFRPQSSFVYLTGFEEPSAVAVVRTGETPEFHLFVRPNDAVAETWDGHRWGLEKAKQEFGPNQSHSIDDLETQLPELLRGADKIYFALGAQVEDDNIVIAARDRAQQLDRRSGRPKAAICDPNEVLAEMRMVKDDLEIELLRESCELSAKAHIAAMKASRPGLNEKQILATLLFHFYNENASREGYCSIVASGANACTLHYRANRRDMKDGDLLLIDAGAEKNYFTADITRTFPVNGHFTEPQKKLYEAVLDVQKSLIAMVKPGSSLPELHEKSCELLTEKMILLGLLSGSVADNIESKKYQKYYPHGIGHFLGMDVHDVGFSKKNGKPHPFVPGVVITVEPGLYVPEDDDSAPAELRGLGVRIEDDVLITSNGSEVLTALVPKEVAELEAIIGQSAST